MSKIIYSGNYASVEVVEHDNKRIVEKTLHNYVSAKNISILKKEYDISQYLSSKEVNWVRKALSIDIVSKKLSLEYIDYPTLKSIIEEYKIVDIDLFFKIAIALTKVIGELHEHHVIHKDINPNNILIDIQTCQIYLIDFGFSSRLSFETPYEQSSLFFGTLSYISPEQTGRLSHNIDYRSDYYSLGIIFYELLAGFTPFQGNYSEVIHGHIAKNPIPLQDIRQDIPSYISDIVLKLLHKNPQDRYQSNEGILHDLQKSRQWYNQHKEEKFILAEGDFISKLILSNKLYGRDKELEQILSAYREVCLAKMGFVLLGGASGTGKSVLIQEFRRLVTDKKIHFIAGKFNELHKNIPFLALNQGFTNFVDSLLTLSTQDLEKWKKNFEKYLGKNGKVITDFIPSLELIMGKQEELTILSSLESQNRFVHSFENFLEAITYDNTPIVFFIDDLQWADSSSLELFNKLIEINKLPILFITAYRPNEINSLHPTADFLSKIKKDKYFQEVQMGNLTTPHIEELLKDSLLNYEGSLEELAKVVFNKTKGNAFFVSQFLHTLYQKSLLFFDKQSKSWKSAIEQIVSLNIADNVVELVLDKLKTMDTDTQEVLKTVACIGDSFDEYVLSTILKNYRKGLDNALIHEFLYQKEAFYKFTHDKIRQACYELIGNEQKGNIHAQIGTYLYQKFIENSYDNKIFDIVNHLNIGIAYLSADIKQKLGNLNAMAGKQALVSSAYGAAFEYNQKAIFLEQKPSLQLYEQAIEAAFLVAKFDELDKLFVEAIKLEAPITQKANIYLNKMYSLDARQEFDESVSYYVDFTKQLGINLSRNPHTLSIVGELVKTKLLLSSKNKEQIIGLSLMNNPNLECFFYVTSKAISAVYVAAPNLLPILIFKRIQLSLKNGNSPFSPYAYISYAYALCFLMKQPKAGYEFAQMAISLAEKIDCPVKGEVHYLYHWGISFWQNPIQNSIFPMKDVYQENLKQGNTFVAAMALCFHLLYRLMVGEDLNGLLSDMIDIRDTLKGYQQYVCTVIFESTLTNLGHIADQNIDFDEEDALKNIYQKNDKATLCNLYFAKLFSDVILGNYEQVLAISDKIDADLKNAPLQLFSLWIPFYNTIACLAIFEEQDTLTQKNILKKAKQTQKYYQGLAKESAHNFEGLYLLISAELAKNTKQIQQARDLYDKAIQCFEKHRIVYLEALANELAARFHEKHYRSLSMYYIQNAFQLYQQWGAILKVEELAKKYHLSTYSNSEYSQSLTRSINSNSFSQSMDFHSIWKASQMLNEEVILEELLKKTMKLIMEVSGAKKGFYLEKKDDFVVRVSINIDKQEEDKKEILQENNLPMTVINYVARTQQDLLLSQAYKEYPYASDGYIKNQQINSILCFPIINKTSLRAIIYLEHQVSNHIFSKDKVEILNILASQINISIENAILYESLEEKIGERTQELILQKEELTEKNKEILSSVNYAKRIQTALQPDINSYFKDCFLLYMPRDIVSGDFYWIAQKNDCVILAVVDCTGHGIPGAFMSMIGNALLDKIVHDKEVHQPHKILELMHYSIRTMLKQEESTNRDGMDAAIISLDKKNHTMVYSGAKNPIIIIENKEMIELAANKVSIGGDQREAKRTFESVQIAIKPNMWIYAFSDGYKDQFGGKDNKKFLSKNFKQCLIQASALDAKAQEYYFSKTILDWKGNREQTDDILLIGIKT